MSFQTRLTIPKKCKNDRKKTNQNLQLFVTSYIERSTTTNKKTAQNYLVITFLLSFFEKYSEIFQVLQFDSHLALLKF